MKFNADPAVPRHRPPHRVSNQPSRCECRRRRRRKGPDFNLTRYGFPGAGQKLFLIQSTTMMNRLTAYVWNDAMEVAYETPDKHIHQLTFSDNHWTDANAPSAALGTSLTGFVWNDEMQVMYQTADGHIHGLTFWNNHWGDADLTQIAANLQGMGGAITNRWTAADLTQIADAAPAAAAVASSGYIWNTYKLVTYLAADGHVHGLTFAPTPPAPQPAGGSNNEGFDTDCEDGTLLCRNYHFVAGNKVYDGDWYVCGVCFDDDGGDDAGI